MMETVEGCKFNRLTVLTIFRKDNGRLYCNCLCDCGNTKVIRKQHLLTGAIKSCGCFRKEKARQIFQTHGETKTKIYKIWLGIKDRCKNPTKFYDGVSLSEEWQIFDNFKLWYVEELKLYDQKHRNNLHVDKDLLYYNNKVYSKETCLLLPQRVNNFLTTRKNFRGEYPLGVTLEYCCTNGEPRYKAMISTNSHGKYLGLFSTITEAHRAWQKEKIKQAEIYINELPEKVASALTRVYEKIKYDYDNNLITESF